MKPSVRFLLFVIGFAGAVSGSCGEDQSVDWLPRFRAQLDPESAVARQLGALGAEASREAVIATAAGFFRGRAPLTELWVMPLTATATAEERAKADKAVDHIITDRSGEFALPVRKPWFEAPEDLPTLSRFPHFDSLAAAYVSTGDERYAAAMVRDMLDFVDHVDLAEAVRYHVQIDPNLNPWNWVLLQWRVKRWIDALAHLRASPALADADYLRILHYLWNEVEWLVPRKVLGLHNGTLGNASAILYAALHYPEARAAAFWQADATALLDGFLDTAFYPREFLIELTLGYSAGTLKMCAAMYEALPASPAKDRLTPKLEALFEAHVGMMKPDRSLPRYGDHGLYDVRDEILRQGAALFDRPDLARLADEPEGTTRADGRLSFPFQSNPYYLSGYYAMRDGWDLDAQYLSMDAGPFGTNHQHGDKLSLTVSADGAAFVVDPGTSLYLSAEPGPRNDLRLGYLHNVITIDGIDPNTGWDRHYAFDVLENRWVTNPVYDFLEGTYEFRNNLLDALWRRSVFFVKGEYWIVLDAIYGEGSHRVESNLQFMIDTDVALAPGRTTAIAPNGATLDLVDVFGEGLERTVLIGDTHFPGTTFLRQYPGFVDWKPSGRGWVGTFGNHSPIPSVRTHPAPALLKAGTVSFPFKTVTVLTPSVDRVARAAAVRVLEDGGRRFSLEIVTAPGQVDEFTWEMAAWPDRDQKIADDAGWWVRRIDGEVSRIIISNLDTVTVESAGDETITVRFAGPFEGRLDRTAAGWSITPDSYNAVTPRLLGLEMERAGQVLSYEATTEHPLAPDVTHPLVSTP